MTKATSTNPRTTDGEHDGSTKGAQKKPAAKPQPAAKETKQQQVLALLHQGTTIAAIMQATGWQQHSVRGFFAGVVRKKLGLALVSDKGDGDRVYRIAQRSTGPAAVERSKA